MRPRPDLVLFFLLSLVEVWTDFPRTMAADSSRLLYSIEVDSHSGETASLRR
jgi:hypothetical protein